MGHFGLSKTCLYSCIIPGCRFYDQPICADRHQIKRHLLRDHGSQELVEIACLYGIISPEEHYHNYDWLAEKLGELCKARV